MAAPSLCQGKRMHALSAGQGCCCCRWPQLPFAAPLSHTIVAGSGVLITHLCSWLDQAALAGPVVGVSDASHLAARMIFGQSIRGDLGSASGVIWAVHQV